MNLNTKPLLLKIFNIHHFKQKNVLNKIFKKKFPIFWKIGPETHAKETTKKDNNFRIFSQFALVFIEAEPNSKAINQFQESNICRAQHKVGEYKFI